MTPVPTKAILVVEDNDTLRQLTIQSLEGEHYWVFSARNVEEAWSLFNEHWPLIDLLMTEVVLPDTDGLELTARVRELNPDLPILYIADEDQLSDTVRQDVESTRNSYLTKPFDHDHLLSKVQVMLKG